MIIQNSLSLLEQLSDIEEKIRKIEKVAESLGIELDQEKMLKILSSQRALRSLTRKKN